MQHARFRDLATALHVRVRAVTCCVIRAVRAEVRPGSGTDTNRALDRRDESLPAPQRVFLVTTMRRSATDSRPLALAQHRLEGRARFHVHARVVGSPDESVLDEVKKIENATTEVVGAVSRARQPPLEHGVSHAVRGAGSKARSRCFDRWRSVRMKGARTH